MIFDLTTLLSNAQAITTATAASTDVLDLGATGRVFGAATDLIKDIGKGMPIPFDIQIVEAFNNLTSLTVTLQCDDNVGFSSPKDIISQTLPLAKLGAGAKSTIVMIPPGTNERFVRMFYTATGVVPTLGKITSGIVLGQQTNAVGF